VIVAGALRVAVLRPAAGNACRVLVFVVALPVPVDDDAAPA
jgi:hypothetical protein